MLKLNIYVQGDLVEASSSEVRVSVQDANDNSPVFDKPEYSYTIQEDLAPGSLIAKLAAKDKDSNNFGKISYSLRGFGTDKFGTDLHEGNLYLIDSMYNEYSLYKNIFNVNGIFHDVIFTRCKNL